MEYTDEHLQNHELDFWINGYKPPFFHKDFYNEFFNFQELSTKKVVDIGCGGAPIAEYNDINAINLTIVDPLIGELIKHPKYEHLAKYDYFSGTLFDFPKVEYDCLVCLNVIDHFNDPEYTFVDKFCRILKRTDSQMWLYFDLRTKDDGDHLMIDEEKLMSKISEKFTIVKIDHTTNPTHNGWSSVYKSIRLIAEKR